MSRPIILLLLVAICWCGSANAQGLPSVEKLISDHDTNGDGKLEINEVNETPLVRKFSRWDSDGDGVVLASEIIKYRAKFGIAADGSKLAQAKPPRGKNGTEAKSKLLPVPMPTELTRADSKTQLTRLERKNSAYVLKTEFHAPQGDHYVVITDHKTKAFLEPLHRLAKHHNGTLLEIDNLATLHLDRNSAKLLLARLQTLQPKFVAVAPRIESFRENMLLHLWELLAEIDEDPQLDAYPGILVASQSDGLARLVEQSIAYRSKSKEQLKPLAISQVPSQTELRSMQKSAILRRQFESLGIRTPIIDVYAARAAGAPKLEGEFVWNLATTTSKRIIHSFSDEITETLDSSNLVIMHGHGSPGMSCSIHISAIPQDFSGKLLLTGSCFSASPKRSDFVNLRSVPGGYAMTDEDAFILRAIDNGAVASLGHMRLSNGFPHLYPVLESWLRGETIGQSYQQLINGLLEKNQFDSRELMMDAETPKKRNPKLNKLLYVLIGDPALQPMVKLID